jgi:hypothetical protein
MEPNFPLLNMAQFVVIGGATAAGTTAVDFTVVDMGDTGGTRVLPPSIALPINPTLSAPGAASDPLTTYEHSNDGFEQITIVVMLGDNVAAGVPTLELYKVDNTNGDNPALVNDVSYATASLSPGALHGTTDDNKALVLTVVKPIGRYFRAKLTRATQNVTVVGALAILTASRRYPVTQHSSVLASKVAYEG